MVFESAKLYPEDSFCTLAEKAGQNKYPGLDYAGEVTPEETFEYLKTNPAIMVDVRTLPEWKSVGMPDLSNTPSKLLTISWKLYPSYEQNPKFIDELHSEPSIKKDTPLFFICRSGGRSLDAAIAATAAGHRYCFNVIGGFTGGFEGEAIEGEQRKEKQGWKNNNLPWIQG